MSRSAKTARKSRKTSEVINFSEYAPKKKHIKLLPKNIEQEELLEQLENDSLNYVVAYGIAGSGKTYIGCGFAANKLLEENIKKIIFVRPNVAIEGESIGALPGDLLDKMRPWISPLLDALEEQGYTKSELEKLLEQGIIEVVPVAYLRGRSFKDSIVLADETQNLSVKAMLSLLTRLGENSKMIILGDIKQTDRRDKNGLDKLIHDCRRIRSIGFVELLESVRNPVIEEITECFET
jgi:phosphate starvation-inducible protein PhoH and related proteins